MSFDYHTLHGKPMMATEYATLPETMTPVQLIEGIVQVGKSPTVQHQLICGNVLTLLHHIVPNGNVLPAPLDVYLDDKNVFQPDILWIADGGICHIQDGYPHGAPALVVEILSPETEAKDKGPKFHIYEQHGVQEYWIVNPTTETLSLWTRKDEQFVEYGSFEKNTRFTSPLLQQSIDTAAIFTE